MLTEATGQKHMDKVLNICKNGFDPSLNQSLNGYWAT